MIPRPFPSPAAVLIALATLPLVSCDKDDGVRVYEVIVPPATPATPPSPLAPAAPAAIAAQSSAVAWTAPADWQAQPLSDLINRGHYLLPESAGARPVLTISAYPGEAGGLAANVNRWRRQLSLPEMPATAEALGVLEVSGHKLTLCDLDGSKPDGTPAAMSCAILQLPGETWFFKLNGPKAAVAAWRGAFSTFLQSLRIGAPPQESATPAASASPASPPPAHAAMPSAGTPKPGFTLPPGWKEAPATDMRAASFRIPGPDGMDADVSVFRLAGGSDLQHVNLWLQQLGLPAIAENELDSTAPIEVLGPHRARIFAASTTAKVLNNAFRQRVLAAIIPAGGDAGSWIVRARGEHGHLEMEAANFRAFVASLQLP